MASTKIKVTPTSRGNFSKLRKYKEGGSIPKYLPGTGKDGVIYSDSQNQKKDILSELENELALANTLELKQAIIQKYNTLLELGKFVLGTDSDFDSTSQEFNNRLNQLLKYGMETYLDENKNWKLRLKPQASSLIDQLYSPATPVEFNESIPERQVSPWTDWLPLTANYINDRINNRRLHDLETKKKFPLQQTVELNALLTDGYLGQQLRSKIAAETRSRANLNLSSNMEYNLASINLAEDRANQLEEQNAVDKNTIYDKSRENLNNIAFGNKQRRTTTANYNAALEALAFNNLITADQKLSTANTAANNSLNTNDYVSHGQWLLNEGVEDNAYLKKVLDYKYQLEALRQYTDSGLEKIDGPDGKYNSKAFASLCAELEADNENGPEAIDGQITQEVIRDWTEEHLNDPRVLAFERAFEKEYNATNSAYEKALQKLQADRLLAGLSQRETVSNLGFRIGNNFSKHRQTNPLYAKEGGKAARFLDYMEHYRKSQDSVAKINSETQKQLRKLLDRDLGILDKETLMLLKYAFS